MLTNPIQRPPTGYTIYSSFHNPTPGSGLATLIRNDIPHQKLNLRTRLQASAFRIGLLKQYTLCNIYISPGTPILLNDISSLIDELPTPALLCGDYNCRHQIWDDEMMGGDARSGAVEAALLSTSMTVLNSGQATHFHTQTGSKSALDLCICSSDVATNFHWSVLDDLYGSDHYPIIIQEHDPEINHHFPERYQEHKADWKKYENLTKINNYETTTQESTVDELIEIFNNHIISAANASIPKSSTKPRPRRVPWWTPECTEANRQRKLALRKYQRTNLIADKITYCRMRAIAIQVKLTAKKNSWNKYVSTLNESTPMAKIWKRIRKIRGQYQSHTTPCLVKNNQAITDKTQIAETMAEHYRRISSNESQSPVFARIRNAEEKIIRFNSHDRRSYNDEMTLLEMNRMIALSGNTAPGEDDITYNMIRKCHNSCKLFLLMIMNKIFATGAFPQRWRSSIVLSFPKPCKDLSREENYRPISLTSCVGKIMEKIVHARLALFLENRSLIPQNQFGFRKMTSTADALNKFISHISSNLNQKQHTLCVSFDLQKAYDTTWRYHIIKTLYEMGLRGHLPNFIQNFLSDRKFTTKIGQATSTEHTLDQGVPQGSVLSCTLFSLSINDLLRIIPQSVQASLYVDDLLIYCSGNYIPGLERRLQNSINKIHTWAQHHGFTFSPSKTNSIHFHRKRNLQPPLLLRLNGIIIPTRDSIKYLGMTIDNRLSWKDHITTLKSECMKRLDILKCISHTTWGSDRTIMLRLYRAIIRSKLDYGCYLYDSAKDNVLNLLNPIHNCAIRLCTGAYRSSPVLSLYADSGEPPLQIRREQLLLQYYVRSLQLPTSAAYQLVLPNDDDDENVPHKSIARRIMTASQDIQLDLTILPYTFPDQPVWKIRSEIKCQNYSYPKKDSCSDYMMRSYFTAHMRENHQDQYHIYSDGAKNANGVGCCAVSLTTCKKMKISGNASIFTAELYGIICALKIAEVTHREKFLILSDSTSAIETTNHYTTTHPLISEIIKLLISLQQSNKEIQFCWCPSHVGIIGNEAADRGATEASNSNAPVNTVQLPHKDWYPIIKQKMKNKWQEQWTNLEGNKLRKIKSSINPWITSNHKERKISIIITRLRIGHTKLTHQYLMENRPQPYCEDCIVPLTVIHALAECPSYLEERTRLFPQTRGKTPQDALSIMISEYNNAPNINKLIEYLRTTNIFNEII